MKVIGVSIVSKLLLLASTIFEAQASGITLCAGNSNSNSDLDGCLGWTKSYYYRNHYFVSLKEPEEEKEPEQKEEIVDEDEITSTSVASVKSYEEMPPSDDQTDVWDYQNGLLVTGDGKCLGLDTCSSWGKTYLWEKSCKPYSLKLQNCPPTDLEDETDEEMSRHMRFLMTDNGQIRSLAAVLDESNDDIMTEKPYCVTMLVDPSGKSSSCVKNEAYLMPCLSAEEIQDEPTVTVYHSWYGGKKEMIREQFFNFEGSSEPFLMPLQRSWGHDDVVEMVYHVGLDSSSSSDSDSNSSAESYEEDEDDDYRISLMSAVTDQVVGTIETPCKRTNGFLDFNPAEYGVTGPITCVMEGTTTSLAVSTAAFEVEPEESHVASKSVQEASAGLMPKNTKFFLGIVCGTIVAIALYLLLQGQASKKASASAAAAAAADEDEKTVSMDVDAKDLDDHDDDDDVTTASSSTFEEPSNAKN